MSQFQRETRYAVFKLKYLTEEQKQRLYDFSMELGPYNSVKECVVVESDWPNYEDTWAAIQAVHNGCYVPAAQLPDGMTLLGRRITELSAELHLANNGYPLIAHLVRQIAFSQRAFGPGLRTGGILDHIAKELKEVAEKPHDLNEWIDVAMLALDGAWRHANRDGVTNEEIAQQVVDTLQAKLAKNEKRDWPDWRLLGEDKAIEHKRDKEAGAA